MNDHHQKPIGDTVADVIADLCGKIKPSPVISPHPLDHPGSVKIALSEAASNAILDQLGTRAFLTVHAGLDATIPEHLRHRLILVAQPATREMLNDCQRIISGTHRVVRIKLAKAATPAQSPPRPHREASGDIHC